VEEVARGFFEEGSLVAATASWSILPLGPGSEARRSRLIQLRSAEVFKRDEQGIAGEADSDAYGELP